MKCRSWLSKKCLSLALFFFLSAHTGFAAVTVASLRMEQENWLFATIPQFRTGMHGLVLSEQNAQRRRIILKAFDQFEKIAMETRTQSQASEHMKSALTFRAGYDVYRNDEKYISFTQHIYQYTGGAHGMNWLIGATIELPEGRECSLADMFLPNADFATLLNTFVRQEGALRGLPLWGFRGVKDDSSFYLTDEGLVLFFQPYEIAPYSEGIVRFLLPYRVLSGILKSGVRR